MTHSAANAEIFSGLGYTPEGAGTYHPQSDEMGDIVSEFAAPSGRVYCKVQFPGGISVINKERLQKVDTSKLPFQKNRQPGRVGATIQGLLRAANQTFTNAEIELFVNKYKSEFDRFNDVFRNFELVDGNEIHHWYQSDNYLHGTGKGQLSNSCMGRAPASWLRIYTQNPDVCKLLILKDADNEDKIKGRALVWKLSEPANITYVDRIYTHDDSDLELYKQYIAQQGWYLKQRYTNSTSSTTMIAPDGSESQPRKLEIQVKAKDYDYYPYLDTFKFYTPDTGILSTYEGEYELEDTGGGRSNMSCDYCGGDGYVECSDCYGRGDVRCEECNGDGRVGCGNCEEEGSVECSYCDGEGVDEEGNECSECEGNGRQQCDDCDGRGNVECMDCEGNGRVNCENCDGNGQYGCPECNY